MEQLWLGMNLGIKIETRGMIKKGSNHLILMRPFGHFKKR
jgi:hypothetical protein